MTTLGVALTIGAALLGLIAAFVLTRPKFRKYMPKKWQETSDEKMQAALDDPELLLKKLKEHGPIYAKGRKNQPLEIFIGKEGVEIKENPKTKAKPKAEAQKKPVKKKVKKKGKK